jgi:RNA polymerase sigma-70 factor (ECF subfamily)
VSDTDTRTLLARWHAGDADAHRRLTEENLPWIEERVRARLGAHLRRIGDLRDFVHEALVDFLAYAPRFQVESTAQLRALLARVVENSIRDQDDYWFRARRRALSQELRIESDSIVELGKNVKSPTPPEERAARNELSAILRLAVEVLEPLDRRVVLLRHWDEYEFDKVAEELSITVAAARKRYQRALPRLARIVDRMQRGDLAGGEDGQEG